MAATSKSHKSQKKSAVPAAGVKPRGSAKDSGGIPPTSLAVVPLSDPTKKSEGAQAQPPEGGEGVRVLPPPGVAKRKEDEWWYRPADSKARKIAEKIMVMRGAGHDDREIAKRLKSTENSVRQYVYLARKNGWLDKEDEPVDLELELAMSVDRKIVRNIDAALDGHMTNWQTHEMTMKAASGRGIFKNHEKTEGGAQQMQVVAIQIVMPAVGAGDQAVEIPDDMCGGVPAFAEGEVIPGGEP
jgi:transposase